MASLEEKRVFEGGETEATCLIASETGLVQVAVSGDRIGGFGIALRGNIRDVAVARDRVLVATDEDVLAGPSAEALEPTGLGPATAVGLEDMGWIAADADGRLVRMNGDEATDLGAVDAVRAIDPPLVGAADGVYRLDPLDNVGLSGVQDVAAQPVQRAACEDGLYRLGNGWIAEHEGPASAVTGLSKERVAAVIGGQLRQRVDDEWRSTSLPVDSPVVDVALGPATYAITQDGGLAVNAGDGWRTRMLGLSTPRRLAVQAASA
jgi:hypothetical protein